MPVRFRDLLIPPRQTLGDDAREIWILYIRLPRTIIARLQGKPPQDHNRKCAKDDRKLQQFSANEYDDREQRDYEQNCYESARLWKIKIERAKRPCCTNECNHPRESPAYVFDYTRAKQGERPFRYALL